jgi:hypothetical protein
MEFALVDYAEVSAEIRTGHFSYTSLEHYPYTDLFAVIYEMQSGTPRCGHLRMIAILNETRIGGENTSLLPLIRKGRNFHEPSV